MERKILDFHKNITINRLFPNPLFQDTEEKFPLSLVFFSCFCKFCGLYFYQKELIMSCLLDESEGLNLSWMMIVLKFLFHHIDFFSNQKHLRNTFSKRRPGRVRGS